MRDTKFSLDRVDRLRRSLAALLSPGEEILAAAPQSLSIEDSDANFRTALSAGLLRIEGLLQGTPFASDVSPETRLQWRQLLRMLQLSRDLVASVPAMIIVGTHVQMHHSYVVDRLASLENAAETLIQLEDSVRQLKLRCRDTALLPFIEAAAAKAALFNSVIESL